MIAPMNHHRHVKAPEFDGPVCEQGLDSVFFGPDHDDDTQIPETTEERREREHAARRLCSDCPFAVDCALHGLKHEEYGVWGGLSETDRRILGGLGLGGLPGPSSPKHVAQRMFAARFTPGVVTAIFTRWKAHLRRTGRAEAARIEEVA